MTKATIVIGANFGDEGKGAAVNHLVGVTGARDIIRFNGGSQAGHTVQTKAGLRHVFHNFGSGTLKGANTWYTKDVLFNPVYAHYERAELEDMGIRPNLIRVNPDCVVISPWDIALNQFKELGRGDARHGSVGHGINEAVTRHLIPEAPSLLAGDLMNDKYLLAFAGEAQDWYLKQVRKGIQDGIFNGLHADDKLAYLISDRVLSKMMFTFLEYQPAFMRIANYGEARKTAKAGPDANEGDAFTSHFPSEKEHVIFEGAQGLLLSQERGEYFPHLTRSNTGIENAVTCCDYEGVEIVDVVYVTRPYLTRHGAGPILHKDGRLCDDLWTQGKDATNKPGTYQGSIRYAHIDWYELGQRIRQDMQRIGKHNAKPRIMVSCVDQLSNQEKYQLWYKGQMTEWDSSQLGGLLAKIENLVGIEIQAIDGLKG
jgi:adenylosuccinate synthase